MKTDMHQTAPASTTQPVTFEVRTLGCQMNVHDSERMAGLLSEAGYNQASKGEGDIIVINTCAVRENADNKLYGNLGILAAEKRKNPAMRIAVAGCLAQKDREKIIEKAPWVDAVVGTHNIDQLPVLLDRANRTAESQIEIEETLAAFPSDMPVRRGSAHSAWVAISVGCNNTCTFCIVPSLRGRERDRRPGEILAEVEALVDQGAQEVTLLGQNVNAYGVEFGNRTAFAELLRSVGSVPGIKRVRFTSPHPRDFSSEVIAAMAQTPTVMPQLHMPLQSGSDKILKSMRRSYRSVKFLKIVADVRAAIPQAAITTDIIIGFPGETESDFNETLAVVEQARFASAYTFQYSPRPGTPAADYPDQVSPDVMADRYRRLAALQESISWEENLALVGRSLEVMITGSGRKDQATSRVSGRAQDNRLVHIAAGELALKSGDFVTAEITQAAPHHLLADGPVAVIARYARPESDGCATPAGSPGTVALGLPGVGPVAPTPVA